MDFISLAVQVAINLPADVLSVPLSTSAQNKFPNNAEEGHTQILHKDSINQLHLTKSPVLNEAPPIHFIEDTKKTRLSEFFKIVLW